MKNLDVVFLTGLFPKQIEKDILNNSKGNIQNAANTLQWNLLKGLEENLGSENIKVYNSLYIGSYPNRYKKIFIKSETFSQTCFNTTEINNIGFVNLPFYKIKSKTTTLKRSLNTWINEENGKQKVIIAYAMTSAFTDVLQHIKKLNPKIVTHLIVPDLPQYMNFSNSSILYKMLKSLEIKKINQDMEFIDSYTFLTEKMATFLNIIKPYTVIEGVASNVESFHNEISEEEFILYSGGLNKAYGILDLVDAFLKVNPNYKLYICGDGDAKSKIIELSNLNSKLVFLGQIPREKVLELQHQAKALINPRNNNEDYTKYSFPSKNIEYMSSGTPLVGYKLDGIPKEYYEYMILIEESDEGLQDALNYINQSSEIELKTIGEKAKEFILENKNSEVQVKKIIDLVKNKNANEL